MSDARRILKDHIKSVVGGIKCMSVDDATDLLAEVSDEMAGIDYEDDIRESILDGLRWGYHAAVVVEMGGGAIVRFIMPRGINITHEWADDADADEQIKAALAAIHEARNADRVTASGVREDGV